MNTNLKKVKLTENDKKTIVKHSDICTDSHGRGCSLTAACQPDKSLN